MAHYTHGYHSTWGVLRMLEFISIVIIVIIIVKMHMVQRETVSCDIAAVHRW